MKTIGIGKMQERFAILEEILKRECNHGPVYYLANPGNWGDALIRQGTLYFFRDINFEFKELTRNIINWFLPLLRGGTVLYGGGGAWCNLWNYSHYVTILRQRFKVIVLPSTYELGYPNSDATFFCRDMFESKNNIPGTVFCHDMAFYLGKQVTGNTEGCGKGFFFRYDKESAHRINIPSRNIDISAQGNHFSDISRFFEEINKFATIYTDRLHVSIAACLLGKEVHFYPSSYFKNYAVYLSSMKGYFENISFHEQFDF